MIDLEKQREGQRKRIENLIKQGKYHRKEFVTVICKHCGKEFTFDKNCKNTQYIENGFCSDYCYRKSGVKMVNKMLSELHHLGIDANAENASEKYSEMVGKRVHNSHDKWLKTNKERHGDDCFIKDGKNSLITKHKSFLKKHKILTDDEITSKSPSELSNLYLQHFNNIVKHGEKIKTGRLAANDGDLDKYKQSYTNGHNKAIHNYMCKMIGDDVVNEMSNEEYENMFVKYAKLFELHRYENISDDYNIKYKKTHLINQLKYSIDEVNAFNDETINKLYSEYLSKRIKKLTNNTKNGYGRTLKGWYTFINNDEFFYRSSWELELCKTLDILIESKYIKNVCIPGKIMYIFENIEHAYFPDFEICFTSGNKVTIEVKPFKKIEDPKNKAKINAAKNALANFTVFTENEIFNKNLIKIIKSYDI